MNNMMKKRNLMVGVSLMMIITSLSFMTTLNQSNSSALSISQTEGKVIAVKYDGVDGESKYKETDKWSDVLSYSWGAHKPGGGATGATRRRGSATVEDFVIVKEIDKSTPKIQEKLFNGAVIPKVEIAEYQGGKLVWIYELKNVQVSSFFITGSADAPGQDLEQITLNFEEVKWTYTEYDQTGSKAGNVEYTWKVEEGTA